MIPMLLACALSFLPTENDTILGPAGNFQYPEGGPYKIVRIIPTDSIMVKVPVWWVKDVMRRLDALENPPKPRPTHPQSFRMVPDSVKTDSASAKPDSAYSDIPTPTFKYNFTRIK